MGSIANVLSEREVKELLGSVLEKEQIIDPQLKICAGSKQGDGYLSFLTQVDVKGRNKDLHVMIKCAPKGEEFRKATPLDKLFEREIDFYTQVFPAFRNFQLTKNIDKPFDGIAKCYKTGNENLHEFLILENIRDKGYRMWNRKVQMDDNHLTLIFKTYARYHAISYSMQQQQPEVYLKLKELWKDVFAVDENRETLEGFVASVDKVKALFDPKKEKEIYDMMDKFNIIDVFELNETDKGNFSIITHGDCWCNNMMFKYEDARDLNRPTDICLLDFQMSGIGSPVLDLSYFFYVSASKAALDNLDNYLKIYHDDLIKSSVALGADASKLMSFEDLKAEWKKYSSFGFGMAMIIVRAMLSESDEIVDLEEVSKSGISVVDAFNRPLKNEELINGRLKTLTEHMYQKKFI